MLASQKQQLSHVPDLEHSIRTLLNKKEYELAAEKLFEAHQLANQQGASGLANLLLAAYQICLSCHQQQQNVQTKQHAFHTHGTQQECIVKQVEKAALDTAR